MASNEKRTLDVTVGLKDTLTKGLKRLSKAAVKFGRTAVKGLTKVGKAIFSLKGALIGLVATYATLGTVSAFRGISDGVDVINKLAIATGDSVENLSEFRAACVAAGGDASAFEALLKEITRAQLAGIDPSTRQAKVFQQLGISLREVSQLSPSQLIERMSAGLETLGSESERLAATAVLLPDAFSRLIPLVGGGLKSFQAAIKEVRAAGSTVTEEQSRIAARLSTSFFLVEEAIGKVKRELLVAFGPPAIAFLEKMSSLIANNSEAISGLAVSIGQGVVQAIGQAVDAIIGMIGVIESIPGVSLIDKAKLQREIDELNAEIQQLPGHDIPRVLQGLISGQPSADRVLPGTIRAPFPSPELDALRAEIAIATATLEDGLAGALRNTKAKLTAEATSFVATLTDELKASAASPGFDVATRTKEVREEMERLSTVFDDVSEKRRNAPKKAQDAAGLNVNQEGELVARAQQRLAVLQQIAAMAPQLATARLELVGLQEESSLTTLKSNLDNNIITADEFAHAVERVEQRFARLRQEAQGGFVGGVSKALNVLRDRTADLAQTVGEGLGSVITSTVSGLGDAIGDAIARTKSLKDAFRDLAKSLLSDIARIIGRVVALGITKSIFGLETGGVALGGVENTQAFAKGGIANKPTLAVFGEGRTAEAFVPLPDNRTIPVTLNGGASGGQAINFNIYAWDSRDAARSLMEQTGTLRTIMTNQFETRNSMRHSIRRAAS